MPLAGCRVVSPIRQQNCFSQCREIHLRPEHWLSRFQARGQPVGDQKKRCALPRQQSAWPLPMLHSCFASGTRGLHATFGRKSIKDIPGRVYPYHTAVIKLLTDIRIALAVNFVAGKSPDMWPHSAPVEDILLVLDLDVLLPGFDDWPIRVGAREAIVQIGMVCLIL